jgi:hypothetical protein
MSLINDALKRATSFKKRQTVDLGAPLQPVMPQGQSSARKVNIVPIVGVVVLVVSVAGGLWWWTGRSPQPTQVAAKKSTATNKVSNTKDNTAAATTNNNPIARSMEVAKKVQALNNEGGEIAATVNNTRQSEPTPGTGKTPTPNPLATKAIPATTAITPATASAASKEFPAVKVQAIYFRQKGASAVLNGKTVKQGDNIDGMKVASIDRNAVRVEFNGQTKSVSLR